MATKTTKSSKTSKSTATKKATAQKKTAKVVKKPVMAPVHECPCHHHDEHVCACGANCKCGHKHGFGHTFKKLIIAVVLMAIGFLVAELTSPCPMKGPRGPRGPRVEFAQNGCMVTESVKCPKLQAALPAMDINQDGCITREEFRAVKHKMRREIRDMQVEDVVPADENTEATEPAPVEETIAE